MYSILYNNIEKQPGWCYLGIDSRSSHCVPVLIKHKLFTSRAPDKAGLKPGEGYTGCTCISTKEYIRSEDSVRIILTLQIEYCFQIAKTSELRSLNLLLSNGGARAPSIPIAPFRCITPADPPGKFCLWLCKGSVWKNMHNILQNMP